MAPDLEVVVESPGTAPGSDPRITSAFMSIVPEDIYNIGPQARALKPPDAGLFQSQAWV